MAWLYTMMGEHQANCEAGFKGATSPFVRDWGVSPKEFLLAPQAARKRGGAVEKLHTRPGNYRPLEPRLMSTIRKMSGRDGREAGRVEPRPSNEVFHSSNLICQLASGNKPAYKLKATMVGKSLKPCSFFVIFAESTKSIHLCLTEATPTQNLAVFFAVHRALLDNSYRTDIVNMRSIRLRSVCIGYGFGR